MIALLPWVLGGGWRFLLGGLAIVAVLAAFAATWGHGYRTAAEKCEAAALKARVEKLTIERDAANEQSERASETAAALSQHDQQAQEKLRDLQQQLDAARRTPMPRAAPDRRAYVDDGCGLTERGVRELGGR